MFKYVRKLFGYFLNKDEDLKRGYKDNIALYIYDNRRKDGRLNLKECNKVADGLINMMFGK